MPICPESRYIIDCSTELLYMTEWHNRAVYMADIDVDNLVDNHGAGYVGDQLLPRDSVESLAQRLVEEWYDNEAEDFHRTMLSTYHMLSSNHQLDEFVSHTALLSQKKLCDVDRQGIPQKWVLPTYSDIKEIVKEKKIFYEWVHKFKQIHKKSQDHLTSLTPSEYMRHLEMFKEWSRQPQFDITEITLSQNYHDHGLDQRLISKRKTLTRRLRDRGRKAIKRGTKLFKELFQNNDIEAFLSGHDLVVQGRELNYRISPHRHIDMVAQSVTGTGYHIPYRLEILDKNNIVLCEACVVFEQTPVIDQIIAVCMYVRSEQERDLLSTANFFNYSEHYQSNPVMQSVKEEKMKRLGISNQSVIEVDNNLNDLISYHIASDGYPANSEHIVPYRGHASPIIIEQLSRWTGIKTETLITMQNPTIPCDQLLDDHFAAEQFQLEYVR